MSVGKPPHSSAPRQPTSASLREQIADPIEQVSGDGAYDTQACYEAVLKRGATPTFVPRRTAKLYSTIHPTAWRATRNTILQQMAVLGRSTWRVLGGCTHQSMAENTIFRFKRLFGGQLWARGLATQHVEAVVKSATLNRMTQ